MTSTEKKQTEPQAENGNRPDWVAKTSKGYGRKARFERVGAAWNRDDGICVRLAGVQIVNEDIYLFPAGQSESEEA